MAEWMLSILAGAIVVLLFGLAILVHELGHFLAARALGLVVDTFAIGFGPALWKTRRNGIEYRVGWIPLGGYVALPQLDPSSMEAVQGAHAPADGGAGPATKRVLPPVAAWRRMLVALAGPAGNLVLAVILAVMIYANPRAVTGGADTTLGTVATNSAAYAAGLRMGDRITRVKEQSVATWSEFLIECHLAGDLSNGVKVAVQRADTTFTLELPVVQDALMELRGVAGIESQSLCMIGGLVSNAPAVAAGVQVGDLIASVDGVGVVSASHAIALIGAAGVRPIRLGLLRDERPLEVAVTPARLPISERPMLGVQLEDAIKAVPMWMQFRHPWRQLEADGRGVFRILRALTAPKSKGEAGRAAKALSGPIVIVVTLWVWVRRSLLASLGFMRFLCVNLAILNLLPIPVLDGGHILFALWEMITGRKPSARVVNVLVNVFAALLLLGISLVIVRDVRGLARRHGRATADVVAVSNDVSRAVAPTTPGVVTNATSPAPAAPVPADVPADVPTDVAADVPAADPAMETDVPGARP